MRLIESLATTEALSDLFSDKSILSSMLDFEVALARVEAGLGLIPPAAADAIAAASKAGTFDTEILARETQLAGTPGLPLVKALTERTRALDPHAAGFVHWGATSQDMADTAFVLLLKQARSILHGDLARLEEALHGLAERHRSTVMPGRTFMKAAPPITFGLKAAGWLGAVRRGHERVRTAFDEALVVQFGGASGTLAALGDKGPEVGCALARELDLGYPEAPWHAHRDRLAALLCSLGILTGTLGKVARDISLLMQDEVSEVSEPSGSDRGGSSTMPHKHNPTGCAVVLAAAHRLPGLVSALLTAMVQEHERGVGGWQSEWPVVASAVQATGLAVSSMAEVAEGMRVDESRMRANIEATRGAIFSERAMMLLARHLGRDDAHKVLQDAARRSAAESRRLVEVLCDMPEVTRYVGRDALRALEDPEQYLGAADTFRESQLTASRAPNPASRKE